jgi:E3 ubiquitin-protein ligase UBR2
MQVLVLALPNRGTFMTPPYVDDYGETDQGLRRGNRLQLSVELYKELEHIWLSHGIREFVSRSMDKGAPQIAGLWNEL